VGSGSADLSLELLVLVVEVPFAQFQVAVAQLLGVLDFLVFYHFLEHRSGSFLLAYVVVVLKY
jgi:hypothetical protein